MKCKVLMLSHSKLAGAFYDTIQFIYGDTSGFGYINMSEPFDQQQYIESIENVIEENKDTGVLILTDLFGGSVNQFVMNNLLNENTYVIAGINVYCLLRVLTINENEDIEKQIMEIISDSKDQMVNVNQLIIEKGY